MPAAYPDLPDRLEIDVKTAPIAGRVRPPGSKSFTNRALVTAALANGVSRLNDPLDADDSSAMKGGLRAMGVSIDDVDDPWLVLGTGGELLAPSQPIDAHESGTVARFLTAVAALCPGQVVIDGRGRMRERPMGELLAALSAWGTKVESERSTLPVTVHGGRVIGGNVEVDPSRSSQFVSALLLVAPMAEAPTTIRLTADPVSSPYLDSTIEVMRAFGGSVEKLEGGFLVMPTGYRSSHFDIEADASAAAYPLVAAAITGGRVLVEGIPPGSTQPDLALLDILESMGCVVEHNTRGIGLQGPDQVLNPIDVDMSGAPDASLAVAVACLFSSGPSRLRGLSTLRHKESDRLAALQTEIGRVGAYARIEGDDLVVTPGDLRPADVQTYNDHRMAMAFALIGLRQRGIVIESPSCVTKTWPNYFTVLGAL